MNVRITATEASRGFSGLLSRVSAGETVEIDRHGEVVAVVVPPRRSTRLGQELLDLLKALPRPDRGFGDDVMRLSEVTLVPTDPWPS